MYKEEQDIQHIQEDLKKLELRRKQLIQQRIKKEKLVAEKRKKAEASWQKKLTTDLSTLLMEAFGETYWETIEPDQVVFAVKEGLSKVNTITMKEEENDEDQS